VTERGELLGKNVALALAWPLRVAPPEGAFTTPRRRARRRACLGRYVPASQMLGRTDRVPRSVISPGCTVQFRRTPVIGRGV